MDVEADMNDGHYFVIYHPESAESHWAVAEFFSGQWFLPGIDEPIPEGNLLIGERVSMPPSFLETVMHAGTA